MNSGAELVAAERQRQIADILIQQYMLGRLDRRIAALQAERNRRAAEIDRLQRQAET